MTRAGLLVGSGTRLGYLVQMASMVAPAHGRQLKASVLGINWPDCLVSMGVESGSYPFVSTTAVCSLPSMGFGDDEPEARVELTGRVVRRRGADRSLARRARAGMQAVQEPNEVAL